MKKLILAFALIGTALIFSAPAVQAQQGMSSGSDQLVGRKANFKDGSFYVYKERGDRDNHFVPSGWMGDSGDIRMDLNSSDNPHSGKTCMKFTYSAKGKGGANWAGIYWQNPANNWGEKKGGYDIRGAKKLTFWARGEAGNERILEFKVGGIMGNYPDSDSASIGPIDLTPQWKEYTIDLSGVDLSYINGGFCWTTNVDSNPNGCVFYIDDVQYQK